MWGDIHVPEIRSMQCFFEDLLFSIIVILTFLSLFISRTPCSFDSDFSGERINRRSSSPSLELIRPPRLK